MRYISLAIFLFFYSSLVYSHIIRVQFFACTGPDVENGRFVGGHNHTFLRFDENGVNSSGCFFSDSPQHSECSENQTKLTINDNEPFCTSASSHEILLRLYQVTKESNIPMQVHPETGDISVQPTFAISNESTGFSDVVSPETSGEGKIPITYNPPVQDEPKFEAIQTKETSTEGDLTTTTEQMRVVNNNTNTTTIETKETTVNNITGDTNIRNTTTIVNPDGSISETQTTESGNANNSKEDKKGEGKIVGGGSCKSPPVKSGDVSDAEFNQILQTYYLRCPPEEIKKVKYKPKGFDNDAIETSLNEVKEEYSELFEEIRGEIDSLFNFSFNASASPTTHIVTIKGVDIDYSFYRFLSDISFLSNIFLLLAYLRAFFIVLGD